MLGIPSEQHPPPTDEQLAEAYMAGRLNAEQREAILDRARDGRRLRDVPYDELYVDDAPYSEVECLVREAHEAAKPENVEWRQQQRAAYRSRRRSGHYDRAYRRSGRRDWFAHSRMLTAEYAPTVAQAPTRARARGAGRPRAAASRSSARSGDSGSDGSGSSDDGDSSPSASAGRSPSLAPRTQRDRVLAALRRARRGITSADLAGPVTRDGGPPVRNLSRVIAELGAAGHLIRIRRVRVNRATVTVYALVREAASPPRHPHHGELTGGVS